MTTPPVATGGVVRTAAEGGATWHLGCEGGDGLLTYALEAGPSHGSVAVNADGTFTYAPQGDFHGLDGFTYRVTDGRGLSSVGTVSVGVGSLGYEIGSAVSLNGTNEYLSRTLSSAGNTTKFTLGSWVRRDRIQSGLAVIMGATPGGATGYVAFDVSNRLSFYGSYGGGWSKLETTARYTTVGEWMQVTAVYDSANAVASERLRLYVNGERVTALDTASYPAQNQAATGWNGAGSQVRIGGGPSGGFLFEGGLAEVCFVDGQALDASAFGEYRDGVWVPRDTAGLDHGATGFRLDFANGASLGTDASGRGNGFASANLDATNVTAATPTSGLTGLATAITWRSRSGRSALRTMTTVAGWVTDGLQ